MPSASLPRAVRLLERRGGACQGGTRSLPGRNKEPARAEQAVSRRRSLSKPHQVEGCAMTSSLRMLALSSGGLLIATGVAIAQQLSVDINRISESGVGDKIGTVIVKEGKGGVTFKVAAKGVPKGPHGFHVHDKGDCGAASKDGKMVAGFAAGPHYDPGGTKSHKGPKGDGHKGDLPLLNAG